VLRRIFALKSDEVTGEWRKLHNEELHNLYPPFDTYNQNRHVKEDEMGKAFSANGGEGKCIWVNGGKDKRKETCTKTNTDNIF
jgi:hypothetical protein